MKVSDELIEVAETAHRVTCIVGAGIENRRETVIAILAAAIPLILEEAARVCEGVERHISINGVLNRAMAEPSDYAQAIRDLKGE